MRRLGGSDVSLQPLDAAGRNLLLAQAAPAAELPASSSPTTPTGSTFTPSDARFITALAAAAGNNGALAMLQDEHRRFARDARDLAEDEFVGDQIGQDGDRYVGKRLDDLLPAFRVFQVFGHEVK